MNILKPLKILLFSFVITVTLAACGGGNSSSEDSSADVTVTTESGVTALFDTNEATVDEIFEFFYDLGGDEFTGTIRWGDNTETRVRGSGSARHIYRGEGEVTISIQVDGGESERVGMVVVSSVTTVAAIPDNVAAIPDNDNDNDNVSGASFPATGTLDCASSGPLTLQSSAGDIYVITHDLNLAFTTINVSINGVSNSTPADVLICPETLTITLTLIGTVEISITDGSTSYFYNAN